MQPTNTLTPVTPDEFDAFDSASNPDVLTGNFDLFGKVEITAWACHLQKGVGKVPYDATNPDHKRLTAIQTYIQPLVEIDVKYPKQWECDWLAEYATWAKITLPSIKDAFQKFAGAEMGSVREINGKWARIARVDSLEKPYDKKDSAGNPTGEKGVKKTFKFVEIYDSEEACRAAYLANGGKTADVKPATQLDAVDAEKSVQAAFLNVIVPNACNGKKTLDEAKAAVTLALPNYPTVAKVFTSDSPEVIALINKSLGL